MTAADTRAWRPAPPVHKALAACGWLRDVDPGSLKVQDYSSSHSLVRVTAPDGRSVAVKSVPRSAWETGRSLLRELYVYRLASWSHDVRDVLPKPILIDERRQLLIVEWLDNLSRSSTESQEFAALLGRSAATWHRATRGLSLLPSLAVGVLSVPDSLEEASRDRSPAAQHLMRAIAGDHEFAPALRAGAASYKHSCLIHGDIRVTNLCVGNHGSGARLAAIDWELSGSGDPAWDCGSCCAELLLERFRRGAPIQLDGTGWPEELEFQLRAFARAYRTHCGPVSGLDASWWYTVVLYTVARLLHVACECAEYASSPHESHIQALLQISGDLYRIRSEAAEALHRWSWE